MQPAATNTGLSEKEHIPTVTVEEVEDVKQPLEALVVYNPDVDVSGIDERKLMRKVDARTLPWLMFLYLLCFLDRTNIGNARLYRMEAELHLTDKQYLLCLTIFFFSYAIFEAPSNLIIRRLRPSIWLPTLMVLWGIIMTMQGFVTNFSGLMALRWMLGMFEAGQFPGIVYCLSCWYKRREYGVRMAIFLSSVTLAGAFGGLLAAAISNMNGIGGRPAWAWIFIIEGLVTVAAGAVSYWIIVDFPDDAKFLTEAERTFIIRRLLSDGQPSAAGEGFRWSNIVASLTDWKTYLYTIAQSGIAVPLYAFSLFLPSIVANLGYKATTANLMTVPVYVVACICTCAVGLLADRYGNRGVFNLCFLSLAAVGFIMLITSRNAALSYAAVFLSASGIYTCGANNLTWVGNNFEGAYKRGVSLAIILTGANLQAAVSTNVYRANQAPWYPLGHGILLMYICFAIVASVTLRILLKAENVRRDHGARDEQIKGCEGGSKANGSFQTVDDAKREKGDGWSGYRYIL